MLNVISWQQYLLVAACLLLAWYVYVGLRYYRPEIIELARFPRPKSSMTLVHQEHVSVMGAAQPDAGTAAHPEELLFANSEPDEISDTTTPGGPAEEFMAEAVTLIDAFSETTDKNGFLALFKVLYEKYADYDDETDLEATFVQVKHAAAAKLPFDMADTDWPIALTAA